MKTSISKNISHSLLLEEDDMKSIFDFLSSRYDGITVIGKCTDGSSLETKDIQEIVSFENLNYRKLKSLEFRAYDSLEESVTLSIKADRFDSGEIYLTSKNDEKALYGVQELTKRLADTKPSYDWLARISILGAVLTVFLAVWLVLQTAIVIGIVKLEYRSQPNIVEYVNQNIFYVIALFVTTYPLDLVRKYLFPKVFFLIGKQKKTMEAIQKLRAFIFVTVILSIILGVAGNWVSSQWF